MKISKVPECIEFVEKINGNMVIFKIIITFLPVFSMMKEPIMEPMNCNRPTIIEFIDGANVLPACLKISLANVIMANIPVNTWIVNSKKHTENAFNVGVELTEN